jgi:gamma-glutamyltranspeptidase/glutathione hydrolase
MVASSQPLATRCGVRVLERGGSAADAAVAVAAGLAVTQPGSTGLGGDCFLLYYEASTGRVHGLNGSGRAPASLDLDRILAEGNRGRLAHDHPYSVTVPGAPAAWADTVRLFGRLSLGETLEPALALAEGGFPVEPMAARWWSAGAERVLARSLNGGELLFDGRPPAAGEVVRLPGMARALRLLASDGPDPFYTGPIAEAIVAALGQAGGALQLSDLASHRSEQVEPIRLDYGGIRVYECPPNGQGLAALIALNILRHLPLGDCKEESPERYHLQIEAMRLGFAEALWHVADPDFYRTPVEEFLSDGVGRRLAGLIDPGRAAQGVRRLPDLGGSDTVYFCTADEEGNACSFINSNFKDFGTGIVPKGWGYALQDRGCCFELEPGHPNAWGPGKRPYHTIIPGMATRSDSGALHAAFGVMGGMMQPQGHVQVISAVVDDDLDPQAALDRPRFRIEEGGPEDPILLEDTLPAETAAELEQRGHPIRLVSGAARSAFGLGQIIMPVADPAGRRVYWGASDPRGDGCALGAM